MHALVIEDQFLIATLIETELRDLGYTTFDIVDGVEEAVEAAEERCPDLITADDKINGGTGVKAVQQICAERIIPVVFIVDQPQKVVRPVPFAATIAKPFRGAQLHAAIGEALVLAQRHAASERDRPQT